MATNWYDRIWNDWCFMNVTPVNTKYYNAFKSYVQPKNGHAQTVNFKGSKKATADDSNISWGVIAGVAVAAFAIVAVAAIGVRNSVSRLSNYAKELESKIGNMGRTTRETARRSLEARGLLEVDSAKLRALPKDIQRQAKEALNGAISNEDYQKVLREFKIWK